MSNVSIVIKAVKPGEAQVTGLGSGGGTSVRSVPQALHVRLFNLLRSTVAGLGLNPDKIIEVRIEVSGR